MDISMKFLADEFLPVMSFINFFYAFNTFTIHYVQHCQKYGERGVLEVAHLFLKK